MKLVILSDYGLDDAAATAFLLEFRHNYELIYIVTVGGNVSAQKSFANAKKLLCAIGGNFSNVKIVPTSEIPQRFEELPDIHGGDGMGSLFDSDITTAKVITYKEFIDTFDDENTTVLSLGSLTVTKDIIQRRNGIKNLVIMAGLQKAIPNFEGLEFNQALDTEACAFCYTHPHVVATLDTCRTQGFNLIDYKPKRESAFSKIIAKAIHLASLRHPDNCYIYDLIASLYIIEPQIFNVEEVVDPCGNKINQLKVNKEFLLGKFLDKFLA